ncbi:N-carbamoyl-L-amino acid hydrolase [bacterium MnTg02]|nr:N-carbamoyl-L-amino acid hydrolase [bacterium MnTg02]
MTVTISAAINSDRLWQRHMDMAEIGATQAGGVHRLALTDEDIEAHKLLMQWASTRGFSVELDAIGNMFIRRQGRDPSLAPVASGSHTDTQPKGGRFDGIFGVLAAFEALEAIDDAGIKTERPIEVIAWNNEEGPRFVPACMGSAAYAGVEPLDAMLASQDPDGISMGECVEALKAAMPEAGVRRLGAPLHSFVEAHIEQGVELEANGNTIGIVTGMQGYRRFRVTVTGEDAHSGTTPRSRRRDSFVAATDMAVALRALLWDNEDIVRFTIGRFEVFPCGISVVPGRVEFTIDLRHPVAETLHTLGDRISDICAAHAGPCEVKVREFINSDPMAFPDSMVSQIETAANRRGFAHQRIYSAASHDARHISTLCPAGMIFIPCWRGISHNEAERAEPEDIAAAAQIIADLFVELGNA